MKSGLSLHQQQDAEISESRKQKSFFQGEINYHYANFDCTYDMLHVKAECCNRSCIYDQ